MTTTQTPASKAEWNGRIQRVLEYLTRKTIERMNELDPDILPISSNVIRDKISDLARTMVRTFLQDKITAAGKQDYTLFPVTNSIFSLFDVATLNLDQRLSLVKLNPIIDQLATKMLNEVRVYKNKFTPQLKHYAVVVKHQVDSIESNIIEDLLEVIPVDIPHYVEEGLERNYYIPRINQSSVNELLRDKVNDIKIDDISKYIYPTDVVVRTAYEEYLETVDSSYLISEVIELLTGSTYFEISLRARLLDVMKPHHLAILTTLYHVLDSYFREGHDTDEIRALLTDIYFKIVEEVSEIKKLKDSGVVIVKAKKEGDKFKAAIILDNMKDLTEYQLLGALLVLPYASNTPDSRGIYTVLIKTDDVKANTTKVTAAADKYIDMITLKNVNESKERLVNIYAINLKAIDSSLFKYSPFNSVVDAGIEVVKYLTIKPVGELGKVEDTATEIFNTFVVPKTNYPFFTKMMIDAREVLGNIHSEDAALYATIGLTAAFLVSQVDVV